MIAAPAPSLLRRTLRRRAAVRPACPSPRTTWTSEGLHRIEIIAPDAESAGLLLEYAAPLFLAEIVPGAALIVRLQPRLTEAGWLIELHALVERWLESAPLPCAMVRYGGRNYLIRPSAEITRLAHAAGIPREIPRRRRALEPITAAHDLKQDAPAGSERQASSVRNGG